MVIISTSRHLSAITIAVFKCSKKRLDYCHFPLFILIIIYILYIVRVYCIIQFPIKTQIIQSGPLINLVIKGIMLLILGNAFSFVSSCTYDAELHDETPCFRPSTVERCRTTKSARWNYVRCRMTQQSLRLNRVKSEVHECIGTVTLPRTRLTLFRPRVVEIFADINTFVIVVYSV